MLNICKLALPVAWLIMLVVPPAAADESLPFLGDVTNGTNLYRMNCAVCHGFDGSGKGPAASTLKAQPADHRDGSLMNARDNQMIYRVIQLGCRGPGCKGAMPAFGDSLDKLAARPVSSKELLEAYCVTPFRSIYASVYRRSA